MTGLQRADCPDCKRVYYERGAHRMIEAARVQDGSSLSDDYLLKLASSKKKQDKRQLADILISFEAFAHRGKLDIPRELNDLRDGLREIKVGVVRFPFFDVPDSPAKALRLTHGFEKKQQETPRKEIDRALWVRREDLA